MGTVCNNAPCVLKRESPGVQVFGNSPDETAYCRLILNKETVAEALTAIQPTLMAHSLHSPVSPVLLDVSSIEVGSRRVST